MSELLLLLPPISQFHNKLHATHPPLMRIHRLLHRLNPPPHLLHLRARHKRPLLQRSLQPLIKQPPPELRLIPSDTHRIRDARLHAVRQRDRGLGIAEREAQLAPSHGVENGGGFGGGGGVGDGVVGGEGHVGGFHGGGDVGDDSRGAVVVAVGGAERVQVGVVFGGGDGVDGEIEGAGELDGGGADGGGGAPD